MSDMDAYKDVFLAESAEFIQQITDGLLLLETEPHDLGPIEVIFRGAHSLKGMSAAMGYERTADMTHKMEGLMDRVRKAEREVDRALVDLLFEATDAVKSLIEAESTDADPVDVSDLVSRLEASSGSSGGAMPSMGVTMAPGLTSEPGAIEASMPADGLTAYDVKVRLEEACVLKAVRAYMVIKRLSHMGTVIDTTPSARDIEDERFDREFCVAIATKGTPEQIERATIDVSEVEHVGVTERIAPQLGNSPSDAQKAVATSGTGRRTEIPKLSETQTVRIAMGHLDMMVDLVGELVILRSRLDRMADELEIRELSDTVEELHRISEELQHEVMNTRMVPVGNIFNRFPRMVRDLSQDLGKDVSFSMDGLDIELDRTVLDEIGDPIVHLLRNSIDHGIELPEDREKSGKATRGIVTLSARRERDTVRITVRDDGRGMDVDRIWDKACTLGISRPEERDAYRDEDVLLLTCTPGFSTATHTTRVSGRGVGMDVVKGKIEHLGGSLEIRSRFGLGSEIEMTLPLTLAIIQALLVSTAGQTFALPLGVVDEVLDPTEITTGTMDGAAVLIGREGAVVPLIRLDVALGMAEPTGAAPASGEHIVLMQDAAGVHRGLIVGGLHGRTEVVIKPLTRLVRDAHGIGGATVLGDGRVALILDTRTIFREGAVDR